MENFEMLNEVLKNWLHSIKEEIAEEVTKKVLESLDISNSKDKIYSAIEICEISKIAISTLNRWAADGLRYTNTGKRTKRFFTIEDIEIYKRKNKIKR